MAPIQQMLIGVGAKKKTYVNDVFSTYLYRGNSTAGRAINNGIDLSGEGGMTWIKARTADSHALFDTSRGVTKGISSNTDGTESTDTDSLTSFNSNGFSLGTGYTNFATNLNNFNYSSWSFRKAKGFFDVVTYTGTGTSTNADGHLDINHSLGSIPAMVIVKRTSGNSNWWVWHRNLDTNSAKAVFINSSNAADSNSGYWNGTAPTASQFTVGEYANVSGSTYVAYLFAGGESGAATARSVDFGGSSGDELSIASTSDFAFGTGDFTIEFWLKWETGGSTYPHILDMRDDGNDFGTTNRVVLLIRNPSKDFRFMLNGSFVLTSTNEIPRDTWNHFAVVRNSGTTSLYVNGVFNDSFSDSTNYGNAPAVIGQKPSDDNCFSGKISNLRIVKGTAVYTSSFRPPTEPLTNITNTKLLCCNNSSVTGSSVTPSTISSSGTVTASSNSPFDDPAGFVFGENEDQNVIKCGSYLGNGDSDGPEIYLGWEPQWILIKHDSGDDWVMFDVMRGVITEDKEAFLSPNQTSAEDYGASWYLDFIDFTSTGFKLKNAYNITNQNNGKYYWVAVRRRDGYVGKPVSLGTGAFNIINGTAGDPTFKLGFVTDLVTARPADSSSSWWTYDRVRGTDYLALNNDGSEGSGGASKSLDFMNGFASGASTSDTAWGWNRGPGFDIVAYKGSSTNRAIAHSLNAVPQMMWVKQRSSSTNWAVYHSGVNEGTNPEQYRLILNNGDGKDDDDTVWNDTAPTATHFSLGTHAHVNNNQEDLIAFLFASANDADGNPISKFGSFTGSSSDVTLNVGFSTRFILIKRVDTTGDWTIFDTTRGILSSVSTYGEQIYTHSNTSQTTYTWTCPSGVSSVSVVCVGGGGGGRPNFSGHNYGIGGGGGGLGYKNNISVSAGTSYTVKVGGRGQRQDSSNNVAPTSDSPNEGDSWFISASTVRGGGGEGGYDGSNGGRGGDYTGDGGGNGGRGGDSVNSGGNKGGGGGAGGYAGNGGNAPNAGNDGSTSGTNGSGGGGGGGFAGGGGVGIMGQGDSGNYSWNGGKGGSGGDDGNPYYGVTLSGKGGNYGGGGGCVDNTHSAGSYGGDGAVRIVWDTAGATRSFPSTNVGGFDDKRLRFNDNDAQDTGDYLSKTSTTVVLTGGNAAINVNNAKYIYYAHA